MHCMHVYQVRLDRVSFSYVLRELFLFFILAASLQTRPADLVMLF